MTLYTDNSEFKKMKNRITGYFSNVSSGQLETDLEKAGYSFYKNIKAQVIEEDQDDGTPVGPDDECREPKDCCRGCKKRRECEKDVSTDIPNPIS